MLHGDFSVSATERFADEDAQIVADPERVAEGKPFTVISTLLDFEQPVVVIFSVNV